MNKIDFSPLYRSSVGYDRLGSLFDTVLRSDQASAGYPPYNIEVVDNDHYLISLAIAGFNEDELNIQVENGVLTVKGQKADTSEGKRFLHQGIATRSFERKFSLAEYVKVTDADLSNGLLMIKLVREIPEAMKPKSIKINQSTVAIESNKEAA